MGIFCELFLNAQSSQEEISCHYTPLAKNKTQLIQYCHWEYNNNINIIAQSDKAELSGDRRRVVYIFYKSSRGPEVATAETEPRGEFLLKKEHE